MLPLVQASTLGVIPPLPPLGAPTPQAPVWHLAVSMIALHALSMTLTAGPAEFSGGVPVSAGIGLVIPGTFTVPAPLITQNIITNYLSNALEVTPLRLGIALGVGLATQLQFLTATAILPILGSPAGSPPPPAADVRLASIM